MYQMLFGKNIFWVLIIISIFSCEEQTDWDFKPQGNGILVVEAIITNELKTQEIKLSLSYNDQNGTQEPVSGAEVSVSDGQNSLNFFEDPSEAGKYLSAIPVSAQVGKTYSAEIKWNGQTYLAENEMIAVQPLNQLTFNAYGNTDSLTLGEVAPLYSPYEQAMYEINIDWSHLSAVEPNRAKLFFYTFSTVDIPELFPPEKETVVFPKGSIVIEKKHSLNDDFAAFYRALALETDWQGGFYDENSASLPTNLNNGALGFFGVAAVLSDTLVAE